MKIHKIETHKRVGVCFNDKPQAARMVRESDWRRIMAVVRAACELSLAGPDQKNALRLLDARTKLRIHLAKRLHETP